MKFTTSKKYQLEAFISDWHWDKESHQITTELGGFLFGFMDYLVQSGASKRVYRTHKGNLWNIGILTCQYGYHKKFSPGIFKSPPFYEYEFRRKMDATEYALKSYLATCNQLSKYTTKHLYKTTEPVELQLPDQIQDFIVGLQMLELSSRRPKKENTISFIQEVHIMLKSCFYAPDGMQSREFILENMAICEENLGEIALKLESYTPEGHYRIIKIREDLLTDVRELKSIILKRRTTV